MVEGKLLILSAGMPRSGSTLVFNMLRELLKTRYGSDLASGWEAGVLKMDGCIYLVKTHTFTDFYVNAADKIIFTYRDVRTVAVSAWRKFDHLITFEHIQELVELQQDAKRVSDLLIKYEELIDQPMFFLDQLAWLLGVKTDLHRVYGTVMALSTSESVDFYDSDTLLYRDHATNTKPEDWRTVIPQDVQRKINVEFRSWFHENSYPLE